ncbi:hypothetical protein GJ496_010616 [Pomphorhynchus laevis]|nr:hypothetical protein GJ496_010616 [Pomphorhynchus laevis]
MWMLLKRKCDEHTFRIIMKHDNKLKKLYAGQICLRQSIDNVLNLSNIVISPEITGILQLGLNSQLKTKFILQKQKLAVEKLYQSFKEEKEVPMLNDESLRCELKNFGLKR